MQKRKIEVLCDSLDDFGRGIVRIDNKAVFVPNLLPGERAIVETRFEYGKLKECRLLERKNDSPDRVKPSCPYYPSCGGCQLMHLSYAKQLAFKRRKVEHLLRKFAKIDIQAEETIGLENPTHYRNKVQYPIRLVNGRIACGFYRTDTHNLVPVKECLAETELGSKVTAAVMKLLVQFHYPPYDEDRQTGLIRHLLVKTSSAFKEALVTLVVTDERLPGRKEFAKKLMGLVPEVQGVVLNVNSRKTNVILGKKDVPIYGKTYIKDKIFDKVFTISTQSFYQTNAYQIERLYRTAIDLALLKKTDSVLDAYCGTGTIGISLSDKVKEVVGVEIVPEAIQDAKENARRNNIPNITFLCQDCTEYLGKGKRHFDVVMMDPPRKGSTPVFLKALEKMGPRKIIYVSCDPVTLSRDIALLKEEYDIEKVVPIDMFPNTLHVETVVSLRKKAE